MRKALLGRRLVAALLPLAAAASAQDRVQRKYETPGAVQAFDAKTGERRWGFYTVPQSADAYGADASLVALALPQGSEN